MFPYSPQAGAPKTPNPSPPLEIRTILDGFRRSSLMISDGPRDFAYPGSIQGLMNETNTNATSGSDQPCCSPHSKADAGTNEPPTSSQPGRKLSPGIADRISNLLAKVTLDDPVQAQKAKRQNTPPHSSHTTRRAAKPEIKTAATTIPMESVSTKRKLSSKIASTISALFAKANVDNSTATKTSRQSTPKSPQRSTELEATKPEASSTKVRDVQRLIIWLRERYSGYFASINGAFFALLAEAPFS
ncbi:hypothetical protein V8F06_009409 [Rhypophila decipiens]